VLRVLVLLILYFSFPPKLGRFNGPEKMLGYFFSVAHQVKGIEILVETHVTIYSERERDRLKRNGCA
jgi:hypothetical protein